MSERVGEPLTITDVPDPTAGDREVVVRVKACGVCHTDLNIVDGLLMENGIGPPIILGHEPVGIIEETGREVTHLSAGDRVGVYWMYGCGQCRYCFAGEEQACTAVPLTASGFTVDGGYAQYTKLPADHAIPVPDGLDFTDAAPLFCAGLTMYRGFKNAGLRPEQRAAVLGIGGLGHLALPIAKAMGAEVIAITSAGKVDLARKLGAHQVVNGADGDVGQQLLEIGGADVVLSTTLDPQAIEQVMQGILPQGALVLTGITTDPLPIVPATVLMAQLRIVGSLVGSRSDMRELLQLAVRNDIRPITEVYPLEEANAVHDRLRANQVRLRAVLTPN